MIDPMTLGTPVFIHKVRVHRMRDAACVGDIEAPTAYAASKGALNMLTMALARNLVPIRVNAVLPGVIDGDWLRGGLGTPASTSHAKSLRTHPRWAACVRRRTLLRRSGGSSAMPVR